MRTTILGAALATGLATTVLAADRPVVTKASVAPPPGPQYFLWVEGGYSHFDLRRLHAFDVGAGFPDQPIYFDIDDGWYGRGEAGFIPAQRLGWIDVISIAVGYRKGSGDTGGASPIVGLALASSTAFSIFSRSPGMGNATQSFRLFDLQVRLKHAPAAWPGFTVGLEPFYGRLNHDASTTIALANSTVPATRFARIDGDVFGMQAAIEGQRQVTATTTLRGRVSLGGYRVNSDAHIGESIFGNSASLSRNLNGVRAGAEVGVDFALAPNINLGVTGGVDRWSKMPFARLTEFGTLTPVVGIDSDNFTDFFVGVRLTIATGAR